MAGSRAPEGIALSPYERWVYAQGVPVVDDFGISDPMDQDFEVWDRLGCPTYFALLRGMEGITGMHVSRIPAGGATNRLRHMYECIVYILEGSGSALLEDPEGRVHQFEWQQGSFFAIPLNAPYRLFAAGQPVTFAAFTTASMVFDLFHSETFVFETPVSFPDRWSGDDPFVDADVRHDFTGQTIIGRGNRRLWELNFVPDIRRALIDPDEDPERGLRFIKFEMADGIMIAHLFLDPKGRYMPAHHHAGGAIVIALRSEGYTLMWPSEIGERPFETGQADRVVRIDWKTGSMLCPPTGWFHQHFNTGNEPFLQLAIRHGSAKYPSGIWLASTRLRTTEGTVTSTRDGGTLITHDNEDPLMGQMYEEALAQKGLTSIMASVR